MSETTNLKLKKHDEPLNENTEQFNVRDYLNGNWDKIEDFAGQVNDKVIEIEDSIDLVKQRTEQAVEDINTDIEDIKQEQTTQNTNIQKNTTDILNLNTSKASKSELQEATIALQAELLATRKDLQAGTLEGQAEGESLYLADSSDARFREFNIEGNSKQEKREGYNKFDIQKWLDNDLNVAHGTVNSKSKDKISLTASEAGDCFTNTYAMSSNVSNNQQLINKFGIEVKPNTAYTIYLDKNNTEKDSLYAFFCDAEYNYISLKNKMSVDNYNILNFTTPENAKYLTSRLGVFDAGKTIEFSNIMLLEGTYTKETLPKYEQYGAMPSLEFPSNVEAVGQDVNLLNLSAFEDTTVNGVEIKRNSADEFDLKGTATGNITIDIPFNAVNLKGDYTLSTNKAGNITSTDIASTQFLIYDTSGNRITFNSRITQNKLTEDKCTITETVAINKARIYIANGTVLDCKLSFKLQKGNKATGYSQHNQGSCNVTVCNRNRFVPTLYANGAEINKARANVTLDGDTFVFECTGIDMYLGNIAGTGGRYSGSCGKLINVKTLNSISIKLTNKLFKKNFLTCFGKDLISLGIKQFMSDNLNNYTLPTGTEYVTLRFGIESPTVGTIYKTQVQIEEGNATDYTAHEEQPFTMPVQEEMLEGDCFEKVNGFWKEKHNFGYASTLNNASLSVSAVTSPDSTFFRYSLRLDTTNKKVGDNTKIYCTHFKNMNARFGLNEGICGWESGQNFCIGTFNTEFNTTEKLKEFLVNNNVEIYYELAEPAYLGCTEAQTKILDKIEQTLHSYKGGTHVYSTDEISPIFNAKYTKDLNAVINNLSQNVIEGGN